MLYYGFQIITYIMNVIKNIYIVDNYQPTKCAGCNHYDEYRPELYKGLVFRLSSDEDFLTDKDELLRNIDNELKNYDEELKRHEDEIQAIYNKNGEDWTSEDEYKCTSDEIEAYFIHKQRYIRHKKSIFEGGAEQREHAYFYNLKFLIANHSSEYHYFGVALGESLDKIYEFFNSPILSFEQQDIKKYIDKMIGASIINVERIYITYNVIIRIETDKGVFYIYIFNQHDGYYKHGVYYTINDRHEYIRL